ncbi:MAG: caspase family protein [Bacteroidota bacterium]
MMKRFLVIIGMVVVTGTGALLFGQTTEKSSGVVNMTMKKKVTPEKATATQENAKATPVKEQSKVTESSQSTTIRMVKRAQVNVTTMPAGNADIGFSWITPKYSSVRTSESRYKIEAAVSSDENIRFINIFVNGEFVKNIIPPVSTIRQMMIDEKMELSLGANQVKVEAVTVTGKKIESSLQIMYDISIATNYALVIAVEEYDDPNINDLDQPVLDAGNFIDVIESDYNFQKENIRFMKNPTKADIIGTLHNMRKEVTNKDNLLIYYAGHGYWDEEMETGYWLPKDAARDNPVDWLPNTDLTNYLNALKTKHTLLIADACFSGGIFETKTRGAFNNAIDVEKLYKLKSRKAITSGSLNEVPDKSEFIERLIWELKNNSNKYLAAEDLHTNMESYFENNSRAHTEPQYGTIQNVGDEGGDFIFIRND